jgi:hypothetical protein
MQQKNWQRWREAAVVPSLSSIGKSNPASVVDDFKEARARAMLSTNSRSAASENVFDIRFAHGVI